MKGIGDTQLFILVTFASNFLDHTVESYTAVDTFNRNSREPCAISHITFVPVLLY